MSAHAFGRRESPLNFALERAAFCTLCLLFFLSPLVRGGNRQVAMIPLEWLGILVLLLLVAQSLTQRFVTCIDHNLLLLISLGPVWLAVLQLTPIPPVLWTSLPGHQIYTAAVSVAGGATNAYRPVSLTPDATWAALLGGLPILAAFVLAWSCRTVHLRLGLRVLALVALMQAGVGLLQLSSVDWLYFGAYTDGHRRAIGTFGNPNHLGNFLAMAMPLSFMAFRRADQPHMREHIQRSAGASLLWGVVLFLLLAGVLASRSRAGVVTAMAVTLLAVLLIPARDSVHRHWRWRAAGIGLLVTLAIASVGIEAVTSRFAGLARGELGTRLQIISDTWQAAIEYFPFGSGLGSFDAIFPRFQSASVVGFVEHAHSDYVQLFMECGLLFIILTILLLWLWCRRTWHFCRSAMSEDGLEPDEVLQVTCGIGSLALLLHSWVDFNMHIPANAIVGAFLLGAYLRPVAQEADEPGAPAGRKLRLAQSGS